MRQLTRYFILFYGLFETFVFTGNIFGWTALHNMFLQIGVYRHLCEEIKYYNGTVSTLPPLNRCEAQDSVLNLAFTIGSFCLGATAFIWGFLLDRWGLRIIRLVVNLLLTGGTILLSLIEESTSYLIFPSLILICLAGVPLRLANMQIADLFPKQRSTIITLYSGAFGASASVFVFIKYGFDNGLPWEWACSILVILSIIMLPITLFLMPSLRFEEPEEKSEGLFSPRKKCHEVAGITPSVWGTYVLVEDPYNLEAKASPCSKREKVEEEEDCAKGPIPLHVSVFSLSYTLHQYWFCWLLLYTILFVGTLHLWSEVALEDPAEGVFFAELYGLLQVTGLFLSPLGGLFMDWSIKRASQATDPGVQRLSVLQSNFWPLTITSLIAVVAQAAQFFLSSAAIWVSIVFVTLFRTFLLSIGTAYLRIRFPAEHFNRLMGVMSTMSALFTLLQFPLFLWTSAAPPQSMFEVNIFNSVCILLACLHPILILVTPLQQYLIKKEQAMKKKFQPKSSTISGSCEKDQGANTSPRKHQTR